MHEYSRMSYKPTMISAIGTNNQLSPSQDPGPGLLSACIIVSHPLDSVSGRIAIMSLQMQAALFKSISRIIAQVVDPSLQPGLAAARND